MSDRESSIREGQRLAYGIEEVAELIGCSSRHVRNLIDDKKLPSVKVGNRRLVRDEDLRALLQNNIDTKQAA